MFSIRLLPSDVATGLAGERLGEIIIGSFRERFAAHWRDEEDPSAIVAEWTESLQRLTAGDSAVALRTDPRFAWLLYRDGQKVYVQQQLLAQTWDGSLDAHGNIASVPPRRVLTEEGAKISEWRTTVEDIKDFLTSGATV
jgi:hypothetical protein